MSKRRFVFSGLILVLLWSILSACGANGDTANQANEAAPAASSEEKKDEGTKAEESAAAVEAETKVVKHAKGETEIPVNPERIAVLFARDVEALLTLGITPIAATTYVAGEFDTVPKYNQALKTANVIDLGAQNTPNLELLLDTEPDLIILTEWHEIYDAASKIAPTIMLDTIGWERLDQLADILGKKAEAEAFHKAFEKKYTEARSILKEHVKENETVLMTVVTDKQMFLNARDFGFNELLYDKLGLIPPEGVYPTDGNISAEGLVDINPDYLFVRNQNEEKYAEIFSIGAVQQINAVKNNRVFAAHHSYFRNIYGEYLSIDLITESITGQKVE